MTRPTKDTSFYGMAHSINLFTTITTANFFLDGTTHTNIACKDDDDDDDDDDYMYDDYDKYGATYDYMYGDSFNMNDPMVKLQINASELYNFKSTSKPRSKPNQKPGHNKNY